jgi:lysine 6-dehydrogenase
MMAARTALVIGAGLMGSAVALDLAGRADIDEVVLADRDVRRAQEAAKRVRSPRVRPLLLDATAPRAVREAMASATVSVSAVPYFLNAALAQAAVEARCHFLDLGGNNDAVARELALDEGARAAGITIVPDCGLAPGMASVLAAGAVAALDRAEAVHLRVGGLPLRPRPPLDYQLVFSPYGLINEYSEPARIRRDGALIEVDPLTEVEPIAFAPPFDDLEAFHTSGGSSTLVDTLPDSVRQLDYKTIRYPGHAAIVKAMLDLGLFDRHPVVVGDGEVVPRELTAALLASRLAFDEPDVVLLRVEATGAIGGEPRTVRYELVDRPAPENGLTAMMRCTGFPAAEIAYLLATGAIDAPGAHPQELVVPVERFVDDLRARGLDITCTTVEASPREDV